MMKFGDIPFHAFDHELLLKTAVGVLHDREAAYPSWVAEGKMEPRAAEDGLRVMRAIVADRQRVLDLRADRPAAPIDATATDFEKRQATAYVHQRAMGKLRKATDALTAMLGNMALAAFEQDIMTYQALKTAYVGRWQGWTHREIGIYLAAEEYAWCTQALHWHTERWPMDVLNAEMRLAELAKRKVAEAA